ncbi:MAG: RodZ domain-containing protein [Phormidesmis sp.]
MTKFSAPQQNQLAQIGAFLRDSREKQEKSLEDIAIRTYIRPQLLNGIETGDPDVLPEPIFVQGFIRRYAETLGLNGIELAQQFIVTSIPSTPRPAQEAPPTDSATTRLARPDAERQSTGQSSNPLAAADSMTAMNGAKANAPMFSSGSIASAEAINAFAADLPSNDDKIELAPDLSDRTAASPTSVEPSKELPTESPIDTADTVNSFDSHRDANTTNGLGNDHGYAATGFGASESSESTETESIEPTKSTDLDRQLQAQLDEITHAVPEPPDLEPTIHSTAAADFSSSISDFDGANLNSPSDSPSDHLSAQPFRETEETKTSATDTDLDTVSLGQSDQPSASLAEQQLNQNLTGASNLESPTKDSSPAPSNDQFDDDLPTVFTTESTTPIVTASSAVATPPQSLEPVGVEYAPAPGPNLKPFIIGGIVAAIATAGIILASMLGRGDRQPTVADNTNSIEQLEEGTPTETPPEPSVEPEAAAPPVSTAPVYVEAEATAEAWVSIIADGTPVFEGTLKPGDTQVWEAQEQLSVYSGDPGALQLSPNGKPAEVMGDRGLPGEKIFSAP